MDDFQISIRVYIEDTDFGGIVYHANYLKFMERARTEWLRHLGYEQQQLKQQGYLFVVKSLKIDYKQPAYLDEQLSVNTHVVNYHFASLLLGQSVCKLQHSQPLCTALVKIVCLDSAMRPQKLPDYLRRNR